MPFDSIQFAAAGRVAEQKSTEIEEQKQQKRSLNNYLFIQIETVGEKSIWHRNVYFASAFLPFLRKLRCWRVDGGMHGECQFCNNLNNCFRLNWCFDVYFNYFVCDSNTLLLPVGGLKALQWCRLSFYYAVYFPLKWTFTSCNGGKSVCAIFAFLLNSIIIV